LRVSRMLVYLYVVKVVSFILVMWSVVLIKEELLILALFFKLRFFPFVWWFPYISDQLKVFCFFLIGILKKIFPLILIAVKNNISRTFILITVLITMVISLVNLFMKQNKIKVFLAWSSKMNFRLILLVMQINWLSGLIYLCFYVFMVTVFLFSLEIQKEFWDQFCLSDVKKLSGLLLGLSVFSGLPPFLGFFCKYIVFVGINKIFEKTMTLVVFFFFFFLMTMQSFIYINMLFKLKLKKWVKVNLSLFFILILLVFLVMMIAVVVF